MKLSRAGYYRFQGRRSIHMPISSAKWSIETQEVAAAPGRVRDFYGHSQHDYEVKISIEDLGSILTALDTALRGPEGNAIGGKLAPYASQLAHLLVEAIDTGTGHQGLEDRSAA